MINASMKHVMKIATMACCLHHLKRLLRSGGANDKKFGSGAYVNGYGIYGC